MLPLSIPFVALLSPLAVNGKLFATSLRIILLGLFSISCVVFLSKRKTTIKLLSGELFLIALLIIVIISFFASTEFQTLSKSLISWIMIGTVFCSTRLIIKSKEIINYYFKVIMICIFYCSIITTVSYYNGIILSDFIQSDIEYKQSMQYDDYAFFLRGSFFYANIGYVIAPVAIISLVHSINSNSFVKRFSYGTLFLWIVFILFLMLEKTGLVALSISLTLLFVISFITPRLKAKKTKILKLIFLSIIPFFWLLRLFIY